MGKFMRSLLPCKNKLLSLALPITYATVFLSSASLTMAATVYDHEGTSLDIFGNIRAMYVNEHAYQDIAKYDSKDNGIYASARLGIAARSSINHGLDAIAMAQWDTKADEQGHYGYLGQTKYMFAGFDAYQYGTLIAGRGDNAYYSVAGATDIFNIIDAQASDYYIYGDQRPSQLMYSLRALSWDLKLSYMLATNELGQTPLNAKRGMSASISTKFGDDITFAYGIDYYKFNFDVNQSSAEQFFAHQFVADGFSYDEALMRSQNHHVGTKKEYGMALSYGVLGSGLYAALVLGTTDYDYLAHQLYTVDTAINYTMDNGVSMSLGYGLKRYEDINIVSQLTVGLSYQVNSVFKLFSEAQFNLDGEADQFYGKTMCDLLNLNENKIALGAEISF